MTNDMIPAGLVTPEGLELALMIHRHCFNSERYMMVWIVVGRGVFFNNNENDPILYEVRLAFGFSRN